MEQRKQDGGTENKKKEQKTRIRNKKPDGGTENKMKNRKQDGGTFCRNRKRK